MTAISTLFVAPAIARRVACALAASCALLLTLAPITAAARVAGGDELALAVGETRSLALSPRTDTRVVVGNPGVIRVTALPSEAQVAITGLSPGISSLVIFDGDVRHTYVVRVHGVPPEVVLREVRQLIEGMPGVDIRQVGNRLVLDGRVYTAADRDRLDRIAEMYLGSIDRLFTYDDGGATRVPMFALQLQVVDLRNVEGLDVGPEWPTRFIVNGSGSFTFDQAAEAGEEQVFRGVIATDELRAGLHLLTSEGHAEIRTTSTLVTEQGHAATYHVGGEFFVRTSGVAGGSVEKITYGTQLAIRPSMDEQRQVRLIIDAVVSQPDETQSVLGVPALVTNGVQTRVNLREGETIVLSGLDDHRTGSSEEGLWPLAEIPVIGYLFKRHVSNEARRRTLILVTPRLYLPGDDFHRRQIEPILERDLGDDDADF